MKKTLLLVVLSICSFQVIAQRSLNDFKYVIVEKQFHFQNEPNQFDLNELTRFLFKKHGFRPILESDVYPDDLKSNYCLALTSEVKAKGLLKTTVTVTLRDCNKNIIYRSEGSTKEKDFNKVYAYGIRRAFEPYSSINYAYVENEAVVNNARPVEDKPEDNSEEIAKLKAEIETLKKEKETKQKTEAKKKERELAKVEKKVAKSEKKPKASVLEAKATNNGFEILDSDSKKVIYTLVKTGMPNVYTLKGDKGIVYKKDGKWIREYSKGKKTIVETLEVDF